MRQPLIGIPGYKIGESSFGVPIPYLEYLEDFGHVRILTLTDRIDPTIDLIVIPGGPDVDPGRYNMFPGYWTSKPDIYKEFFDTKLLPSYINNNIPVFGICRGIQTLAVLFGGTLQQHMYHETNDAEDRSDTVHEVELLESTFKTEYDDYSKEKIKVNSMHHQCVSRYKLPECLEVLGEYRGKQKNSKYIEVLRHRTLNIYGVQYHPEELYNDNLSYYIINQLIMKSPNWTEEEVKQLKTNFEND
mgnify:CR=1 FL=1